MKKSISYRAFPGGPEGAKRIAGCFRDAEKAGFAAVELFCFERGMLSLRATEKQCAQIREQAERRGVAIAGLASDVFWRRHLASATVNDRSKAEQAARKMIKMAAWLGAGTLAIMPGAVDVSFDPTAPALSYDVVYERARQGIKRLLKNAEQVKVTLAIENAWNRFLLSPLEMRDFIDGFKSAFVGACFNVGVVVPLGYPEQWIRILGKRLKHVRLSDCKRAAAAPAGACGLLEGDVNWPAVTKALGATRYDGYCTLDMIPNADSHPLVRIRNASQAMDAILGVE